MNDKSILLTEENVFDVYKKLSNRQEISTEELEQVKQRFFELVKASL